MALEPVDINKFLTIPKDLTKIDKEKREFLERLQGNILKPHGRSHAAHVFIQFGDNVKQLKKEISKYAPELTSAFRQEEQAKKWNVQDPDDQRQDGGCFVSLLLSYSGYQRLGVPEDRIPGDPNFRGGMRNSDKSYFRGAQDGWNQQFGERVDAMVLMADNAPGRLQEKIGWLKSGLMKEALAESFKIHWGTKRVDEENQPIEWFGFRDNIGQPRIAVPEGDTAETTPKWPTLAPLNLALAEEPNPEFLGETLRLPVDAYDAKFLPGDAGGSPTSTFGSYMAFQKLEQNVARFRVAMNRLAEQLGEASVDEVSARAVGRRKSGEPLITGGGLNNFNYKADPLGEVCPFHAHIRKVNPRGEIYAQEYPSKITEQDERNLQILRRGIPYDDRSEDEKRQTSGEPPESRVGLLFISYQRELAQFLAKLWMARSDNFVRQRVGPDPLLGRGSSGSSQEWRRNGLAVRQRLTDFVTLKGGEYLFAPSIPFLKSLGRY